MLPELPSPHMARIQQATPAELHNQVAACHRALDAYHRQSGYTWLRRAVSGLVLLGQFVLLFQSWLAPTGWLAGALALVLAWLLADLINGLIHLWMDHNQQYSGWAGPLVAAFHLHHRRPRYEEKPLWRVYVHESGFKLWLPPILGLVWLADATLGLPPVLLRLLAAFALFSSLAELSHFICHNRDGKGWRLLARMGLLLDRRHHARHHREDNVSYAFLNGWSDRLIDWLAARAFSGYKQGTDLHVATWQGDSSQLQHHPAPGDSLD